MGFGWLACGNVPALFCWVCLVCTGDGMHVQLGIARMRMIVLLRVIVLLRGIALPRGGCWRLLGPTADKRCCIVVVALC